MPDEVHLTAAMLDSSLSTVAESTASVTHEGPARDARLRNIVTQHYAFVWRSLRHLGVMPADADDAAQQVLIVVAQKLDQVAVGRERSFLFATAMRIAHRWRRTRERRRELDNSEGVLDQLVNQTSAASDRAPARALLDQILEDMPDDMRAVFMLYEVEQFTMLEIASLLELPTGTVASRLRRARDHFRTTVSRLEARGRRGGGGR
jgi:RNA polymerase sigma-70 factor, ECF subfamily